MDHRMSSTEVGRCLQDPRGAGFQPAAVPGCRRTLGRYLVLAASVCLAAALSTAPPSPADDVTTLCEQGLALKRAGDLERAVAAFEQALALDPNSVQAHWGLAWVLAARGRREEAVREFRLVVDLSPDDDLVAEATAALRRLGAPLPTPAVGPPPVPMPRPLPAPPSLAAARELLAAGQRFASVSMVRALLAEEPEDDEAQALLARAKSGRRRVLVRAAAGPVFRSVNDWEARLRSRFDAAAKHLGRQVEIDLVLLAVDRWDRDHTTADGLDLVTELQDEVPPNGAHAVIGFVADNRPPDTSGDRVEVHGYTLGMAPCFTGYGVVSEVFASDGDQEWRVPEAKLRENLLHEVGHLFGAVHVSGNSVMRPDPGGEAVYRFDPLNVEVMRTCRWVDFEENLASLSPDELARMADLYAKIAEGPGADDGVHFYRAAVLSTPPLERYEEAIDEYRQVLAASSEDPFAHFNIAELYNHVGHLEQARAHWKIAAFIGKPATVAVQAQAALDRTEIPQHN